jgi:hypothetical protein
MQREDEEFIDGGFDGDGDDELPARPRGLRFGEGQPINRAGRPRGAPNLATMTKRVAVQRHKVIIDGKTCRKTTLELVLLKLKSMAAQGDRRAFALLQTYLQRLAPRQEHRRAVLIASEKLEGDEWFAVHGFDYTDEQVEERFPYLMPARREHQRYRTASERQSRELQEAYHSKSKQYGFSSSEPASSFEGSVTS